MSNCHSAPQTARDLVRGRCQTVGDIKLPGMLYGRMLLSPVSRGRINGLDLKKALAIPGVKAALGAVDCPPDSLERIAAEEASYAGQPVAAVAASSPEIAEKAVNSISVQYDEMTALLDWDQALAEAENLVSHTESKGDPDAAFSRAALVLEDSFELPSINPVPPEPWTCLAEPRGDGLTLWTNVYYEDETDIELASGELADCLGLEPDSVELISLARPNKDFYSYELQSWELYAAALALESGRPVRMALSRREESALGPRSAAMRVHSKLGLDKEGRILAHRQTWDLQCGVDLLSQEDLAWLAISANLLYGAPVYQRTVRAVGGNLPPYNVLPGLGALAPSWALESQLNQAAKALGLDPLKVRKANLLEPGACLGLDPFEVDDPGLLELCEGDLAELSAEIGEPVVLPENAFKTCLDYAIEQGWGADDAKSLACFAAWGGTEDDVALFCGVLALEAGIDPDTAELKVESLELVHSANQECDFAPALIMGLGIARTEDMQIEKGRAMANSPAFYRLPLLADLPRIKQTGLGKNPEGFTWAPGGAVVSALAAAVHKACGWVPGRMPLAPERILRGMGKILG